MGGGEEDEEEEVALPWNMTLSRSHSNCDPSNVSPDTLIMLMTFSLEMDPSPHASSNSKPCRSFESCVLATAPPNCPPSIDFIDLRFEQIMYRGLNSIVLV